MCVIMVCTESKPSYNDLLHATLQNDDGIGIMYYDRKFKTAKWEKGLMLPELKKILKHLQLPYAIHFRFATSGSVGPELTHPFPIEAGVSLALKGRGQRLLMHNGCYNTWQSDSRIAALSYKVDIPQGVWSDTRALAWLGHLAGLDFYNFTPDRVVILDAATVQFFFYGDGWVKESGITYSSLSFRPLNIKTREKAYLEEIGRKGLKDWRLPQDREWQIDVDEATNTQSKVQEYLGLRSTEKGRE